MSISPISTNPTLVKSFQTIQQEVEKSANKPLAETRHDMREQYTNEKMLYVQAAGLQQLHEDIVQLSNQVAKQGQTTPAPKPPMGDLLSF